MKASGDDRNVTRLQQSSHAEVRELTFLCRTDVSVCCAVRTPAPSPLHLVSAREAQGQWLLLVSKGLPYPQERQRGCSDLPGSPAAFSPVQALGTGLQEGWPGPPGPDRASSCSCSLQSQEPWTLWLWLVWCGGQLLPGESGSLSPDLFLCQSASKKPILNLTPGYLPFIQFTKPTGQPQANAAQDWRTLTLPVGAQASEWRLPYPSPQRWSQG